MNKGRIKTFVVMAGMEYDVFCDWRWNDDELEVENAFLGESDLLDELSADEFEQLRIRIQDEVAGYGDPRDDLGDWRYQQRKDDKLGVAP